MSKALSLRFVWGTGIIAQVVALKQTCSEI